MNEILDFLVNHWQLSILLVAILAAYLGFELMQKMSNDSVSPDQAVELINHQRAVVIDVRSTEEFRTGHILDSIHFDCNESDTKLKSLHKYNARPVIIVCAHGKRSSVFLKRLEGQGFTQVLNLDGGLQAWRDAGLPLVTGGKK